MRVFDVDGEKMKGSNPETGGWHDIFMNNAPVLEVSHYPDVKHRPTLMSRLRSIRIVEGRKLYSTLFWS